MGERSERDGLRLGFLWQAGWEVSQTSIPRKTPTSGVEDENTTRRHSPPLSHHLLTFSLLPSQEMLRRKRRCYMHFPPTIVKGRKNSSHNRCSRPRHRLLQLGHQGPYELQFQGEGALHRHRTHFSRMEQAARRMQQLSVVWLCRMFKQKFSLGLRRVFRSCESIDCSNGFHRVDKESVVPGHHVGAVVSGRMRIQQCKHKIKCHHSLSNYQSLRSLVTAQGADG